MTIKKQYSVLFICLGNICRSPLGEGIFRRLIEERRLEKSFIVDSCGIGSWYEGEPPHKESCRIAKEHGLNIDHQRARQIRSDDFLKFNLMIAMDQSIKADLEDLKIGKQSQIRLMREFDKVEDGLDVPDPFNGPRDGFKRVYDMTLRCCEELLSEITKS